MTTLQESAMRKALELGKQYAKCLMMNQAPFDEALAALAQQVEQQPVCACCGIPAGDVHMSTCQSGKWPSRVSNGDTAAPAPVAQAPFNESDAAMWLTKNKLTMHETLSAAPVAQEPVAMLFGTLPVYDKSAPQPAQTKQVLENLEQLTAPQPAQPVGPNIQNYLEKDNRLSDDEILSIAHRKATRYTHAVAPGQVTYGFSVTHLLDFARAVLEENPKHLVAAQPKTCETCAHFEQGKLPGVRIHDETCYGCRQYYGSQWEARNE